jgi:hypothetical protein
MDERASLVIILAAGVRSLLTGFLTQAFQSSSSSLVLPGLRNAANARDKDQEREK